MQAEQVEPQTSGFGLVLVPAAQAYILKGDVQGGLGLGVHQHVKVQRVLRQDKSSPLLSFRDDSLALVVEQDVVWVEVFGVDQHADEFFVPNTEYDLNDMLFFGTSTDHVKLCT